MPRMPVSAGLFGAALCAVVMLAGCGSVPQPFRGTPKVTSGNPLIDVPAAMGVEVLPVSGLAPETSERVAHAVAERLLAMEIPAEPVDRTGALGFALVGRAGAAVTSPGGQQFDVDWTVRSRRGQEIGRFSQRIQVPSEGPVAAAGETAAQVAFAMGLTDAPPASAGQPAAQAKPALPSISVKPVDGAPGDGRESLRLAVLLALTDAGLRRDDVTPDISLSCALKAEPYDSISQKVVITWRATLRDGRELGQLNLENVIPNGALEGPWGPTAFAIAAAAQPNLVRLLTSAPAG